MHLRMKIVYDTKNRGRSGIRNKGDVIFVQPVMNHNENFMPNQNYEEKACHTPFPDYYQPEFWNEYNHPSDNRPTHLNENRQIYTRNFVGMNSTGNIVPNQDQGHVKSEDNDIRLLVQSHAKITALVYRQNLK